MNLGPRVNSPFNDYGPALAPDGATLFFASNRPMPDDARQPDPAAWSATLREDFFHRPYDLYAARVTPDGVGAPAPLASVNTREFNEGAPAVSSAGDFLYFSSDRSGGFGGFDLYRARLMPSRSTRRSPPGAGDDPEPGGPSAEFPPRLGAAENLGPSINTSANELDPATGMGGFSLFFSSNRPMAMVDRAGRTPESQPAATSTAGPQPAEYAVYHTVSREVFRDVDTVAQPINWAGLWRQILPRLLWCLLALLGLLVLLALIRDAKNRRFSLLTKCLLASLATHALILFLLNLWQVGTVLAVAMRGGGTQVILGSAGAATGGIATQFAAPSAAIAVPAAADVALVSPPVAPPAPAAFAAVQVALPAARTGAEASEFRIRFADLATGAAHQPPTPVVDGVPPDAAAGVDLALATPPAAAPDTRGESTTPTADPDRYVSRLRRSVPHSASTQPATHDPVQLNPPGDAHGDATADRSLAYAAAPQDATVPRGRGAMVAATTLDAANAPPSLTP